MRLLKGHGTQNDFLVLPDLDGEIGLSAGAVRALCDRHAGLGADGVLRVVRSAVEPEAQAMADRATYFMDYRNADGTVAEMCGNGIRVFLRYLQRVSLVGQDAAVATRGGVRRVRACGGGDVTVHMGLPRILADRPIATAAPTSYIGPQPGPDLDDVTGSTLAAGDLAHDLQDEIEARRPHIGLALEIPNPHVVVPLPSPETLAALDLTRPPRVEPSLPHGQNVEFVVLVGERHLRMRVHERGVGETRSCGTGICAAAVAVAHAERCEADGVPWCVDVPGGSCTVTWTADGEVLLTGPAVLVGEIEVDDDWLRSAAGS